MLPLFCIRCHCTNHGPMAAEALFVLDRQEAVLPWVERFQNPVNFVSIGLGQMRRRVCQCESYRRQRAGCWAGCRPYCRLQIRDRQSGALASLAASVIRDGDLMVPNDTEFWLSQGLS